MQPGIYFTSKLNPLLVALDAKKDATERATKAFTNRAFCEIAAAQFKKPAREIKLGGYRSSDVGEFVVPAGKGVELHITSKVVGGAVSKWIDQKDKADEAHKDACKKRCKVADLLDNGHLKAFTARVRAIYGQKKEYSINELDAAYADWTRINAPHVCPA